MAARPLQATPGPLFSSRAHVGRPTDALGASHVLPRWAPLAHPSGRPSPATHSPLFVLDGSPLVSSSGTLMVARRPLHKRPNGSSHGRSFSPCWLPLRALIPARWPAPRKLLPKPMVASLHQQLFPRYQVAADVVAPLFGHDDSIALCDGGPYLLPPWQP